MQIEIPAAPLVTPVPRETRAAWLKPRSHKIKTAEPWGLWIDGEWWEVPAGYVSDWSTIPRPVWWLYPPSYSEARQGALWHDYCYSHLWPIVSRRWADECLREIMRHDGAGLVTRQLFYGSVRLGRGGGWYRHGTDPDPHWQQQFDRFAA